MYADGESMLVADGTTEPVGDTLADGTGLASVCSCVALGWA